MRPGPAAHGRSPTPCRRRWRTSRMARPCSSSSGGGRRSGWCSARRGRFRRATKPIVERVRADGPLLPPLTLALARWIAEHYLAPPALVIRAMLPPGLLERLELVAERTPAPAPAPRPRDPMQSTPICSSSWRSGRGRPGSWPRPMAGPGCCVACATWRRAGSITLDWTLLGAGAGPRYERWVRLLPAGRAAAAALAAGERPSGRALGPRQVAALAELAAVPTLATRTRRHRLQRGRRPGGCGRRGGRTARQRDRGVAGSARACGDRCPRATAPATGRPSARHARWTAPLVGADRGPGDGRGPRHPSDRGAQPPATPPRRRDRRRQDGDLCRGDRGVARGGEAGPGARPRDRAGVAAGRPAAGRSRRADRARALGAGRRRTCRRVAPHPSRRRGHRRRDAAGGRRPAGGRRARHRRRGARPGIQERPDAAAAGARHRDPAGDPRRRRARPRFRDAGGR